MKTDTITLIAVSTQDHKLRSAAHQLAVTGRPIMGRPSELAATLVTDPRLIVLLAVSSGSETPVGVLIWSYPGPSRRIPSAAVLGAAVAQDLTDEALTTTIYTLARGVVIQMNTILSKVVNGMSGYVVADLPQTVSYGKLFVAAGWMALQAAVGAKTTRHVAFVFPSSSSKATDDSPEPD